MDWVGLGIGTLISFVVIFVGFFVVRRLSSGASTGQKESLLREIEGLNESIEKSLRATENYCAKGQLDTVVGQLQEVQSSLAGQKDLLKEIERKLEQAQKTIEEKEAYHQSLKSAKAEDDEKVAGLLARYDDIAAESISLEQRLATSMKSLDQMLTELQLTQEQVIAFQDVQSTLTDSSSQLRQLYLEYEGMKKRIDTLNGQLEDLEVEYTKLVEQQLGE